MAGHGDWVCQNIRFRDGEVAATFDWDSLIGVPEAVIAGLSAGAYTEGGTGDASAPSPEEAALFLADYDARRAARFTPSEQAVAAAAAAWVIAYNARCGLSAMDHGLSPGAGSPPRVLERNRDGYRRVRW